MRAQQSEVNGALSPTEKVEGNFAQQVVPTTSKESSVDSIDDVIDVVSENDAVLEETNHINRSQMASAQLDGEASSSCEYFEQLNLHILLNIFI